MAEMLATLTEYERELIMERIAAGIAAPIHDFALFDRSAANPEAILDKLTIAADARTRRRTVEKAARLVGRSSAAPCRHQGAPTTNARATTSTASLVEGTVGA